MDLLARSLRGSCPDFHSLMFDDSREVQDLEALICHCSTSGLRKLHTMVFSPEDTPISTILQHSATLEDLLICRREAGWERNGRSCTQTAAAGYLRLLTGRPKLTRFSLILSGGPLDRDLVDTLQEQRWACRGLQELELKVGCFEGSRRPMIAVRQEMTRELASNSWERVADERGDMLWTDNVKGQRVQELIEFQDLEELQTLILDRIEFRRVASATL